MSLLLLLRKGPLQKVERADDLQVWIKRDDLMHPYISGNKGRKLQGYLERAQAEGIGHIVTCGGPYSNHLLATAAACQLLEIRCTLLIRGYQQPENPYRRLCEKFGASVHWLSAAEFEQRRQIAGAKVEGPYLFIDTGGEGPDGESACGDLWDELPFEPDILVLATATGTTMRGLLSGRDLRGIQTKVCGIPCFSTQQNNAMRCSQAEWTNGSWWKALRPVAMHGQTTTCSGFVSLPVLPSTPYSTLFIQARPGMPYKSYSNNTTGLLQNALFSSIPAEPMVCSRHPLQRAWPNWKSESFAGWRFLWLRQHKPMDIERHLCIGLQLLWVQAVVHSDGAAVESSGAAIAVVIQTGGIGFAGEKGVLREIGNGASATRPNLAYQNRERITYPEAEHGRRHIAFCYGIHGNRKLFKA
jgi:hypothetical protein